MAELLKLSEAARELGISEPTARRYVKSGKLPSLYLGGRYMIRREDIDAFLDEATVKPGEDLPKGGAPSSREARRSKVRLGDVLSDRQLRDVEEEHARLNESLKAGEITSTFYARRLADLYASMIGEAERSAKNAG